MSFNHSGIKPAVIFYMRPIFGLDTFPLPWRDTCDGKCPEKGVYALSNVIIDFDQGLESRHECFTSAIIAGKTLGPAKAYQRITFSSTVDFAALRQIETILAEDRVCSIPKFRPLSPEDPKEVPRGYLSLPQSRERSDCNL